ncbi:MAG: hypothetical protein MJ118_06890, partial [Clostridia bacterium]|nr:hypothetical protein [Clostridia bacterium]
RHDEPCCLLLVADLAKQGAREPILLAQDTTRYGTDWQEHSALPEQMRNDARADAEEALRGQKAVERIAELENVTTDEQEMNEQLEAVCRHNNMTMDELKPYLDETFYAAVRRSVVTGKVLQLLREKAVVTVTDAKPIA